MKGIFVTGTDTNVGKTVVSAILMSAFRNTEYVRYWKPIQTGIECDNDTETVRALSESRDPEIVDEGYRLEYPVSPHLAASIASVEITINETLQFVDGRTDDGFWIVEGAGGVFVPLNDRDLMSDLMVRVGLPILVVSRPSLGTINHTLLTIEALRNRSLQVVGVVLNGGSNEDNARAIAKYGQVPVIAQIPQFGENLGEELRAWASVNRECFEIF